MFILDFGDGLQGELIKLWELRAKADYLQWSLLNAEGPTLLGIMTEQVLHLANYAASISPWLYGVLSSAHRSVAVPVSSEEIVGTVYIDPSVVHPVLGGRPVVYGVEVHDRKPWMQQALEHKEQAIYDAFGDGIILAIEELF